MIDFVKVGQNINTLRKRNHLTQDELSAQLFVTRQALSKWENGSAIPSIETLLALSKIFSISFEELLCLDNDEVEIDQNNIFNGHDRNFIITKILRNEITLSLPDVFYQFSPSERLRVLKAIKEGSYKTSLEDLYVKLTVSEQKYLGGNLYEKIL